MRDKEFVFQSLFFNMNKCNGNKRPSQQYRNNKPNMLHRKKVNQIEEDVSLVNNNISLSSNKVYSLYQKDYLINYKRFIMFNKQGSNPTTRIRNTHTDKDQLFPCLVPIRETSGAKDACSMKIRKYSNSLANLIKTQNKPQWKKQENKVKLNNKMLSKVNCQICSLTEAVPDLKEKTDDSKYKLYEMNDYFYKQKRRPFKM